MNRKSFEIEELRKKIYARDGYKCRYPGCKVSGYFNIQMAHRIRQHQEQSIITFWMTEFSEIISKKQATEIIHNELNIVSMCPSHNSSVDITFNPEERRKLLIKIANKRKSC